MSDRNSPLESFLWVICLGFLTTLLMSRVLLLLDFRSNAIFIYGLENPNQSNEYLQDKRSFMTSKVLAIYYNSTPMDYWTALLNTSVNQKDYIPIISKKRFLRSYEKQCKKNSFDKSHNTCPCVPDTLGIDVFLSVWGINRLSGIIRAQCLASVFHT